MHRTRVWVSVLFVSILLASCAPTQTTTQVASPCNDTQYLALKKKQLSELSEREYEYLKDKEKACDEFNRTSMQMQQSKEMVQGTQNSWLTWYLIIAGCGIVASVIMMSSI